MLFMKGPDCNDELAEAQKTRSELFRLDADHAYQIPGTPHDRRLVTYERLPSHDASPVSDASHAGEGREVASEANPTWKRFRDLLSGKGMRKHGKALIAGPRIVAEVLKQSPEAVEAWLSPSAGPEPPIEAGRVLWLRLSDPLFRAIDVSGTNSPVL